MTLPPFESLPPVVRKSYALGAAMHDPALGSSERTLMWWFCEHANEQFEAWPSTRRLARVTGIDHRNVSRHIAKLVNEGYLVQTYPGSRRGESARYLLTFNGAELIRVWKQRGHRDAPRVVSQDDTPVVSRNDTQGVVSQDDTVSSPMTQGVVSQDARVSSPRTTEPPTEPAQKAGEVGVGGFGTGPGGPALAAERDALFKQFGAAYPKAVNVADAKTVFEKLLDDGVPATRLIEQARALRQFVESGGMKFEHTKQPAAWLRSRAWEFDNYSVLAKRATMKSPTKAGARATTGSDGDSVAAVRSLASQQAAPDWEALESERNRKRRQFAPTFFETIKDRLSSVEPDEPLAEKLTTALERALRKRPALAYEDGGIGWGLDRVGKIAGEAVAQALSNDWGDDEGLDDDYDPRDSILLFGNDDAASAMTAAVDEYVAQEKAKKEAEDASAMRDADERERAPLVFERVRSALTLVDVDGSLVDKFRRVAKQWRRDDPEGLNNATGVGTVDEVHADSAVAWGEAEQGEFGDEDRWTRAQWWFGAQGAEAALLAAIERCFGAPGTGGSDVDVR